MGRKSGTEMQTTTNRYTDCMIFFFQAEDGIRYYKVTGVQTCALPISLGNFVLPVMPWESHILGPQHYRQHKVAQGRGNARDEHHEDHDRAMEREHLVVNVKIGRASCRERVWI